MMLEKQSNKPQELSFLCLYMVTMGFTLQSPIPRSKSLSLFRHEESMPTHPHIFTNIFDHLLPVVNGPALEIHASFRVLSAVKMATQLEAQSFFFGESEVQKQSISKSARKQA